MDLIASDVTQAMLREQDVFVDVQSYGPPIDPPPDGNPVAGGSNLRGRFRLVNWPPNPGNPQFQGGYTGNEVRKIYDDLYMRAEILEYMIAAEILNYDEVLESLLWIQGVGVEPAHAHFKKEAMMKKGLEIETEIAIKLGKKVD